MLIGVQHEPVMIWSPLNRVTCPLALAISLSGHAYAQSRSQLLESPATRNRDDAEATFEIDGSPDPVHPGMVTRDSRGRVTLRATRVTASIRVDGRLDEEIYTVVPGITDFIQTEPNLGAPASAKTELWILFDDNNVYVTGRCWERPEHILGTEMRREGAGVTKSDSFSFSLDTFYDRRNLVYFQITPGGGFIDAQTTNNSDNNLDWNPVWDLRVRTFDGGWIVEAALPFKSLRYPSRRQQIWGFNARRQQNWNNEVAYLSLISNAFGRQGITRASESGTLVGIEAPVSSMNLDVKPYAISSLTTDTVATPPVLNKADARGGIDIKYGITNNLTADLTYKTDFAQVEADEQQINLTRFSLFFPEKREFFLENQGTFGFGGASSGRAGSSSDTPILFYSRRIGLTGTREVPIVAGGRLTGRVGPFELGVLNIRTDAEPGGLPQNFGVYRLTRQILAKSYVGAMFINRSVSQGDTGSNQAYGLDATIRPSKILSFNGYWAQTKSSGLPGQHNSYRAQLDYAADRYGVQVEHLMVGAQFDPQVGLVRRGDMRKSLGLFRFSPRPKSIKSVRKLSWTGKGAYITNTAGRLETRELEGEFSIQYQSSDELSVNYSRQFQFLTRAFAIAPRITLPASSGYEFSNVSAMFMFGPQRPVFGSVIAEHGSFYGGRKSAVTVSGARVQLDRHLSIEPSYTGNWIELPQGAFTTHLIGSRFIFGLSPRMFTSALLQFNSSTQIMSSNVRFRWEYQPGSELFVVYNDQRDTALGVLSQLTNRAVVVKINRMFRL